MSPEDKAGVIRLEGVMRTPRLIEMAMVEWGCSLKDILEGMTENQFLVLFHATMIRKFRQNKAEEWAYRDKGDRPGGHSNGPVSGPGDAVMNAIGHGKVGLKQVSMPAADSGMDNMGGIPLGLLREMAQGGERKPKGAKKKG